MPLVSIQVPGDAIPGDVLTFRVDGTELEFSVPEGAVAGDVLEVQIGSSTPSETDDQDLDETELQIPVFAGDFLVVSTEESESNDVSITCDETHRLPWRAGLVLADFLSNGSTQLRLHSDSSVLELGSGLGVTGLSFGAHFKEQIKQLCLSDHPSALGLLQKNVSSNICRLPSASVVGLEWSSDKSLLPKTKYDWIIGSDIFYNIESIPSLIATIDHMLSESGQLLISVRWRKPDLEREFFQRLESRIEWKLIFGQSNTSWKEYGSNSDKFMQQTMVGIAGKPKAIGLITESELSSMSKVEYDIWDTFQVQVYHGCCKRPSTENDRRQLE